jgi:CheY-like chemotaxis protein
MDLSILQGKKVLIVDDEPDVIETIVDLLDKCQVDSASDFASARALLSHHRYDAAILDIMGVNGFGLLDVAVANGIPSLILTAHALSADSFKQSIRAGANAYVPKDEMIAIPEHLAELLAAAAKGRKSGQWFARLGSYFDRVFGADWKTTDKVFWDDFKNQFVSTSDELRRIL